MHRSYLNLEHLSRLRIWKREDGMAPFCESLIWYRNFPDRRQRIQRITSKAFDRYNPITVLYDIELLHLLYAPKRVAELLCVTDWRFTTHRIRMQCEVGNAIRSRGLLRIRQQFGNPNQT
jgi:hypothetical protein